MSIKKSKNLAVLILAAGKGTRMKSDTPKVLHTLFDRPMISFVLQAADKLNPSSIGIVIGHKADAIKKEITEKLKIWKIKTPVKFIIQTNLTGSGSAVISAEKFIKPYESVMIICGDTPLIQHSTLSNLFKQYGKTSSKGTVLSFDIKNPYGYGRILKDKNGDILKIIEESHTDKITGKITEVNSGMYIFDTKTLLSTLGGIKPKGPKKEFYLTDAVELISKDFNITACKLKDYTETLGINSKSQLAEALKIMQHKINAKFMDGGVIIINSESTYVNPNVKIGKDSIIYPNVFIEQGTIIGRNVKIETGCVIRNSYIGNNVLIKAGSYIEDSNILQDCIIGPYAHIRPKCKIGPKVKFGNFCEAKSAQIMKGAKVPHLSYIGDSVVGKKVNIGAGTITCNYDGKHKYKTVIEDEVFVGSNVNFIAPIRVKKGTVIGAGSTITDNIPSNSLAIARARQIIKRKK